MGRQAFDSHPVAREYFIRASELLGFDLAAVCFNGPAERLDCTEISQPALFVCSLIGVEILKLQQPDLMEQCVITAGLSLGEYTAMVFAGAVSFEDGLKLVHERGRAMQAAADAVESGMVSILGMELARIEELCLQNRSEDEVLQVANHLCPGNIVVSGHRSACARITAAAEAAGAMKVIPLSVAGAFHTPIMQPAVNRLRVALDATEIGRPRIPVVSNVDAVPHFDPDEIRRSLVQQVISPVRWEDSIRMMVAAEIDCFWEIGPGRVLRGLLKRIDRKLANDGITV